MRIAPWILASIALVLPACASQGSGSSFDTGQVGINVGTPAPIAFYPVGGRKSSFFGALRGRGVDAVDFYTDKKVVVTTWHDTDGGDQAGVDPTFEGEV